MRSPTSAEFAILTLLGEGPRHGYEIEKLIEQRGLREWTEIGFSSIYFLLDKLRRSGLVEPLPGEGGARSRRPYRLTGEGERTQARETLLTTPALWRRGELVAAPLLRPDPRVRASLVPPLTPPWEARSDVESGR